MTKSELLVDEEKQSEVAGETVLFISLDLSILRYTATVFTPLPSSLIGSHNIKLGHIWAQEFQNY